MIVFWVCLAVFAAAMGGLTWHLAEPPEYRRPMYKTPRARRPSSRSFLAGSWARITSRWHPAPLPRRRVRDLDPGDARTVAWVQAIRTRELRPVTGVRAAPLRLTAASMVWQAITHHLAPAAIPPTETPELDYSQREPFGDWLRDSFVGAFAAIREDQP